MVLQQSGRSQGRKARNHIGTSCPDADESYRPLGVLTLNLVEGPFMLGAPRLVESVSLSQATVSSPKRRFSYSVGARIHRRVGAVETQFGHAGVVASRSHTGAEARGVFMRIVMILRQAATFSGSATAGRCTNARARHQALRP